jgi:hypothetical protein
LAEGKATTDCADSHGFRHKKRQYKDKKLTLREKISDTDSHRLFQTLINTGLTLLFFVLVWPKGKNEELVEKQVVPIIDVPKRVVKR